MFGKKKRKQNNVVKLGSETTVNNGIIHLLKDGDNGGYCVWRQPIDNKGRRLYTGWKRLYAGGLGDCRRYIKSISNKNQ
ncbi:MAG: hypothetical protein NC037_01080 [Bacteroides sp.]|nr:hypothetical protein [Bacillota bacterium]MCM1393516.1 hypothetical protein [[Eubacterium] siraeum]MCM1455109.1 hypothetical protein [Bacteroides sp.]